MFSVSFKLAPKHVIVIDLLSPFFLRAIELFIADNPGMFTMTMGTLVIADPDGKDGQIYCSSESCECADFQAGRYCWHRVAFAIMASQTQG
jgi:hypothetical protein